MATRPPLPHRFQRKCLFLCRPAHLRLRVGGEHNWNVSFVLFPPCPIIPVKVAAKGMHSRYWGSLSDRIGRKPVLLMGCMGTIASLLVVGLSPNFWVALFGRFLGGALNGNIGVIQTMVAELVVNPKHERKSTSVVPACPIANLQIAKAYAVMPFVWSVGTILGPSIGGYFASPTESWPGAFPRHGVFDKFPYLLPNLICVALMFVSVLAGYFCLEETHPDMQPWSTAKDLEETEAETPILPAQAGTTTPAVNLAQESYGTFNAVSEEEAVEEWDLNPDGTSRPASVHSTDEKKVFTKKVVMLTIALGIFTYHSMTYDHLLPIYFQDDRASSSGEVMRALDSHPSFAGGLGLSVKDVGVIMSFNGIIALVVQALVFPLICSWLGVWRTFILVSLGHPIAYFIVPYLAFLPEHLLYPGIYICLTVRNVFSILAYPLLLILIKEASPRPSCLGKINGAAASTGAACRTMASPIAGFLYGIGIQMQFTAIAWWASALVAVVGAVQVFWIQRDKKGTQHKVAGVAFMPEHVVHREHRPSIVHIKINDPDSGYASVDEETPILRRQ